MIILSNPLTLIYKIYFPCITSHSCLLILNRQNFLNMFNRLSAEQKKTVSLSKCMRILSRQWGTGQQVIQINLAPNLWISSSRSVYCKRSLGKFICIFRSLNSISENLDSERYLYFLSPRLRLLSRLPSLHHWSSTSSKAEPVKRHNENVHNLSLHVPFFILGNVLSSYLPYIFFR